MNSLRTRFYRDKVHGKFFGICAGIADYTGVHVMWIRLAAIGLTLAGAGILIPAYFLAGFIVPAKPGNLYVDKQETKFWQGVRQSPARTARQVKAQFRDIDRRLADIETYYVSNNPRLSAEIERLR